MPSGNAGLRLGLCEDGHPLDAPLGANVKQGGGFGVDVSRGALV